MKVAEMAKEFLQSAFMPGSFMWRLPPGARYALSFDDGPHPVHTPAVLDLLAEMGVHATFFLVGDRVREHPELVRRIADEGHRIGSHTQTHRELPSLDGAQFRWELQSGRESIRQASGVDTWLLRPPRGRIDLKSLARIRSSGYRLVHWSRTYSDYLQDGADPLLARIRSAPLRPRDIVLFHDTNAHTIEALRKAIPEWLSAGCSFTVLP